MHNKALPLMHDIHQDELHQYAVLLSALRVTFLVLLMKQVHVIRKMKNDVTVGRPATLCTLELSQGIQTVKEYILFEVAPHEQNK